MTSIQCLKWLEGFTLEAFCGVLDDDKTFTEDLGVNKSLLIPGKYTYISNMHCVLTFDSFSWTHPLEDRQKRREKLYQSTDKTVP